MKELFFELDGDLLKVKAQKIEGVLWYHWDGRTHTYRPQQEEDRERKSLAEGETNPHKILAPMPGKIVRLLKKPGDPVKAGETVVVMTAMKMEYHLKVHHNVVIKKVLCCEGETVELEQKLVETKEQDK